MSKKIKVAVCKGRHEIPQATDGAIFGNTIKEMDPFSLLLEASKRLFSDFALRSGDRVDLYVTGLTMATLAIVNACLSTGIRIVCYHYDRETGELHVDESKIELGIDSDFTPEAKPEITREDIEEAKREAQIEMVHRIKTYSLSVSFENAKNLNKTGNCFYDGKIEAYKDINEMCEALLYRLGEED